MSVKIIKLISGDELIAKFEDGKYSKVRAFQVTREGAGLTPWMILAPDADLTINPAVIATEIDATAEVEKQYLQAVSNIQLLS